MSDPSSPAGASPYDPPSPVDVGRVDAGRVVFDAWRAPADAPSAPPPAPLPPGDRVGFAVVGLGRLALEEILPAFGQAKQARLAALVSGSPDKLATVAHQYGVAPRSTYDYAGFDRIIDDPAIRAVYIALPNAMHREFVERAARAGKHVLCEKPMATSVADARAMVAACAAADVRLMIAYRIQYQPHTLRALRFVRERTFGRLVGISAVNVQTVAADGAAQWRHKARMSGGGALPDIGLYLLNTARFLTGEEPVALWATQSSPPGDPRFTEVEETMAFTLRFASGSIVNSLTSYGARDDKHQRLNFETATVDMPEAYSYRGQSLVLTRREGDETARTELIIPEVNVFAAEIDHFADCLLTGRRPRTPGEEGVQDQVLMDALYASARNGGQPVTFAPTPGLDAFRRLPD